MEVLCIRWYEVGSIYPHSHFNYPSSLLLVCKFLTADVLQLTEETVFSVLCVADVYLLNGLKRLCARVVSTLLDEENVLHVLRTARLFDLAGLEADCCKHIAKNLEKVNGIFVFKPVILTLNRTSK